MGGQDMTDYSELVKALTCGNDGKLPCHNNECPYWVDQWHGIGLCNILKKQSDAAAAIEELDAEETRLLLITSELQDKVVELEEWLNDADVAADDNARQIEELQAQLMYATDAAKEIAEKVPKLGEWVGVSPTVDTVQCSICGGQLFSAELETPYCPYCGAKMNDSNASNASNALNALGNAHDGLIVRCRECRYRITSHGILDGWVLCSKPYTERGNAMHRADWFCADGERREV